MKMSSWTLYLQQADKKLPSTISVKPSDTIQAVKGEVQALTGVQSRLQHLFYEDKELVEDRATLLSYRVQNWGEITLVSQAASMKDGFDLSIKTLSGKNFCVEAKPGDTVGDICSAIYRREGIPSEQQQLIYGGKVLEWDRPLDHYSIQRESALHVVYASKQRKVYFRLPASTGTIPATILLTDTVGTLSKRIEERFKIPVSRQQIFSNRTLLESNKPLSHYSIESGIIIDIVDQGRGMKPPSLSLFIKTRVGKPVKVECLAGDTILSIKEKLHSMTGLEPARQLLLLAGNPLEDGMTINAYNIENETTLHLMPRSEHNEPPVQIFIRTLMGKTISLNVKLADTVRAVKGEIQKREGIPSDQQNLLVRGQPLSDALKLRDCNIEAESTLYLTLSPTASAVSDNMTIFIKFTTGKILDIRVSSNDTVKEVKEKIRTTENVSVECQKLCLGGIELMDDIILSKYNIRTKCMLNLQVKPPPPPKYIYVRNLLGKNIAVEVLPTDTVKNLKLKISGKEGIPVEHQKLILRGTSLEDEELMEKYNIEEESNLQLTLVVPKEEELEPINIFVRLFTGKILTIEILPSAQVRELKEKVHKLKGLPPAQQRFFLNGAELDDNVTLSSCNLDMQTTLQLTMRAPESPPSPSPSPSLTDIFIKTPLGKTVTISVALDEKVSEVKAKISKKAGIDPAKQTLLFQGKELQDDLRLTNYGIDRESNLAVVLRENKQANATSPSPQLPSSLSVSVLVSKHSPDTTVGVLPVESVATVEQIQQSLERALHTPQSQLRLFWDGKLLTNKLCRLLKQGSVLTLGKTNNVCNVFILKLL